MQQNQNSGVWSGRGGKPSPLERHLIKCSQTGVLCDCDDFGRTTLSDRQRTISAQLLVQLVTGKFSDTAFPKWRLHDNGLQLNAAIIDGHLSLDSVHIRGSLDLSACVLGEGLDLDDALIDGDLNLQDCRFGAPLFLRDAKVAGQVNLLSARIEGEADDEQQVDGEGDIPDRQAIVAHGLEAQSFALNGAEILGHTDLLNAAFSGQFNATGAKLDNASHVALSAENLSASSMFFDDAEVRGTVALQEARLEGQFSAFGTNFVCEGSKAIFANGARMDAWNSDCATVLGELDLIGLNVTGQFQARGIEITNHHGPAIQADYASVGSGMFLKPFARGKDRRQTTVIGSINLNFATIEKILDLSEVRFTANEHVALAMRGASIIGEAVFRDAQIEGHLLADAIRVEGRFSLKGSQLSAQPVATLKNSKTDQTNLALRRQFKHHALVLREANISGRLVLSDKPAKGILDLSRARCDILEDFRDGWPDPLSHKRVGPKIKDGEAAECHTVLDGFEYSYLEHPSGGAGYGDEIWKKRVDWLSSQSERDLNLHFNPQPWRHASDVLRKMGYEEAAQKVTIRGRVRQRKAQDTSFGQFLVSCILHYTANYGFNPWKTIFISAFWVVLFGFVYMGAHHVCQPGGGQAPFGVQCSDDLLFVKPGYGDFNDTSVESEYPSFKPFFYSMDVFVPLLDFGEEKYWLPNTKTRIEITPPNGLSWLSEIPVGSIIYVLVLIERILGAVLMAIAITGFTGLLARNES